MFSYEVPHQQKSHCGSHGPPALDRDDFAEELFSAAAGDSSAAVSRAGSLVCPHDLGVTARTQVHASTVDVIPTDEKAKRDNRICFPPVKCGAIRRVSAEFTSLSIPRPPRFHKSVANSNRMEGKSEGKDEGGRMRDEKAGSTGRRLRARTDASKRVWVRDISAD